VVYAGKTLVTKFTGHFENDQMNGPGKVYFSTGDRMSARWENGKPTFPMSMVYERGERYVGQFRVHQTSGAYVREGFGISIYLTGDRYYGMWENDLRAGHGFFVTTCGTEYFGKWEGNLMSGKGMDALALSHARVSSRMLTTFTIDRLAPLRWRSELDLLRQGVGRLEVGHVPADRRSLQVGTAAGTLRPRSSQRRCHAAVDLARRQVGVLSRDAQQGLRERHRQPAASRWHPRA